jgi:hypothetical protein
MATISNTPRPGYVWDATDNVWYPIGVGGHGHTDYITQATAVNPTIIDAKGDILTATAADTPARLAVGNNGETLVADSSTSTGLRYSSIPGANLLANGSFDIWQRGTSGFSTNQAYSADRWFSYSMVTATISQETSIVPDGATNALKVNITSANGYVNMQYAMEQSDVQKLRGKTITFSVYLRADATYNGSFNMSIQSNTTGNTQTGGTWSTVTGASTSHTPSTSAFTRISVTGTVPTNANGLAFYIGQNATLANNSNYYIALAKAEIGSVATTWSRAGGGTIQGELAACQRYYYRLSPAAANRGFGSGLAFSSTAGFITMPFPVEMRVRPSALEQSGTAGDYALLNASAVNQTCTSVPVYDGFTNTRNAWFVGTVGASLTGGNTTVMCTLNTNGFLGWSAEL